MEARKDLCSMARNGLREMAACGLKARGPRRDGGLLSGWARRLFREKSLEEVREITFGIGMLGQHELDINDSQEMHVPRALLGRAFSALELLCIMYAGFKRSEPGMNRRGRSLIVTVTVTMINP